MAAALRITHPSQLSDVATSLAGLAIDRASDAQDFVLALLQPLDDPDILAACHHPNFQTGRRLPDGYNRNFHPFDVLDIAPLSTAWRHALSRVAPIHRVTFDITLPQRNGNRSISEKFVWYTDVPVEGALAIRVPEVVTLVCTLATKARMRANGQLRFGLVYDTHYTLGEDEIGFLKKQLEALSGYKSHPSNGEQNGQPSRD